MDNIRDTPGFSEASIYGDGFVYLAPQDNNVYNLRVTDPSDIDPRNYFTLSQKGITHFCGDESEFTSIHQYEREYYLYNMITSISFFQKYRLWKTFVVWKKNVSTATMNACKASLQQNLFILNPLLRKSLIALRKLSYEVSTFKLYHVDPRRTYTLEEFCEMQAKQKEIIADRLRDYSDEVRHLVRNACETALRQFLDEHGFHGDSQVAGGSAVAATAMGTAGVGSAAEFGSSSWGLNHSTTVGDQRAPQRSVTFTERAAMRTQCRRLAKYIRVADFFVIDTYLGLALGSTKSLLGSIQSHHARVQQRQEQQEGESKAGTPTAAGGAGVGDEGGAAVDALGRPAQQSKAAQALAAVRETLEAIHPDANPLFKVEIQVDLGTEGKDELLDIGVGNTVVARSRGGGGSGRSNANDSDSDASSDVTSDGENEGVYFWPKPSMFKQQVEAVIFDGLKVVTSGRRLLNHTDFRTYVAPTADDARGGAGVGEGLDLEMMVVEDAHFQDMVEEVNYYLGSAFDNALTYAHVFQPFREMVLQNLVELKGMSFDQYSRLPLTTFSDAIAKYKREVEEFKMMPSTADVGIIRVDSLRVKAVFEPSPSQCLSTLTQLLPEVAATKNDNLYAEVSAAHEKLAASPFSVDDFVALMSNLQATADALPELDERFEYVKELYALLDEEGVSVSDEVRTNHYMLGQTMSLLKHSMQLVEDSAEDNTLRFSKELDDNIPKLRSHISEVRARLDHAMVHSPDSDMDEVLAYLAKISDEVDGLNDTAERYRRYQEILRVNVASYEDLEDVQADLRLKRRLWEALKEWGKVTGDWRDTPFATVDVEAMTKQVMGFAKTAMQAERGLPGSNVAPRLKARVDEFRATLPVVGHLCSASLKERHWKIVHELIGYEVHGVEGFTLGQLMELRVTDHAEAIATVAGEATQEAVLEEMLGKVLAMWAGTELELLPHKEARDVYILGALDDIIANLDDSLVSINTILGSRYVTAIRDQVVDVQKRLILFQETLDEWVTCQRNWMYLETIFSAPDISRQLPMEAKQFTVVDTFWKEEMKRVNEDNNALKAGTKPGLREKFQKHNATLDVIQKSLEDYLETKRVEFPRFYFLSNDELLEILAQTKDPRAVQPHLRKCFDNLVSLQFRGSGPSLDIVAMESGEKEVVDLGRNLKARGNVEEWLTAVEDRMRTSLRRLLKAGIQDFYSGRTRVDWVRSHAGQVVATAAQVAWCAGTESALRDENSAKALAAWFEVNVRDLGDLTRLVRGNLSKLHRRVIVALVTTDVHARDIVEELLESGVNTTNNFRWQQQLRYYWNKDEDDCLVQQSSSFINYGYEYQGCTSRLVITPLTDRCWMTLTGALHLKLGGSPAGPAGTGKTESSKDLAKALGIQCIVFNCSDQIDYKMMGKLFSGLAQAGAWTCLDEFNRIDIEVLSVIAQQLHVLRRGRLMGAEHIVFSGRDIALKEHHVIITMNPGYAGRTPLPDNLKVFFRPVAMMVPDYALIAEIMLFAEGFDDARNLSRKMTKLYKLSSEQLSQQCHYDYGLRAVKSVLVMAGSLKRGNPDLSEDIVLIRAMRDSNVPKFLADDLPLFFGIVNDLFPGVEVPYQDMGDLQVTVEEVMEERGLQRVPKVVKKIIQLYETMAVRFGVVIVGPTGGGKTTSYSTLSRAMTALRNAGAENQAFQVVHTDVLNPKCISMGELYGEFNELTQEWTDGLASTIMRRNVATETEDRMWTVFDGPIDALWIENMNTVLDDNMTLCLANSERIKLKVQMRMLFEVQDLEVASPATVSRLGVVYMTPEDLGWLPYVQSWLPRELGDVASQAVRDRLLAHFEAVIPKGLGFVREHCREPVPTVDLNLVTACCRMFQALYSEKHGVKPNAEDLTALRLADKLFAFSFVWSIGGSIDPVHWAEFSGFTRSLLETARVEAGMPGAGLLQDYFVEAVDGEGSFRPWDDIVPSFTYDATLPYFEMLVPTADTVRYSKMLSWLLAIDAPVFLTGVTGTGKTVILQDALRDTSSEDVDADEDPAAAAAAAVAAAADAEGDSEAALTILPVFLNFSARTSSAVTQGTIEGKLEKKRSTLLGAPVGRKVVVVVDDVNMPAVEEYGAQPPIELLRQFLDFKGFYDRSKRFWKDIENTALVVAAAPPGGGRNPVTPRFVRHFNVMCLPSATDHTLTHIFSSILNGFFSDFLPQVKALAGPIVSSTIEVYSRISAELLPTPARSHYTFNLRDVSKLFQGILMVSRHKCSKPEVATRLWIHEAMRVFHDRLINAEDKRWFTELIVDLLSRNFRLSWNHEDLFEGSPIVFANYMRPGAEERLYEECRDMSKIVSLFDDYLEEYNLSHSNAMTLVFFQDAVEHVTRLCRVLAQPRGNAMLVGVGGSGKQSLTRLASAISEYECVQIELTRGYSSVEFREDLKKLMITTGVQGSHTVFLFTDTQVVEETFLEDVNSVLNSGEVPNLFPADELDAIMGDMRAVVKEMGRPESRDVCYATFVQRVRDHLHVVLAMSPVGDALRTRCRMFPSLINCCTIDWYDEWPREALVSVASRFLAKLELPSEEVRTSLVECCAYVHHSLNDFSDRFFQELRRKVYTTPKSYLDLINLYLSMLEEQRAKLKAAGSRLVVGVEKLNDTNAKVDGLQEELTRLQPVLVQKTKETEELIKQLAVDQADAAKVRAKVEAEESVVKVRADAVAEVQADAQRDLDVAMPALENALKALDSLDKKDITEVKSFAKPPVAVQTVMEAVCVLLGEEPDWDAAKKLLSNSQFIANLQNYDKDNIGDKTLRKLRKYVNQEVMQVDNVKKVSVAATSLCMWVHAMHTYSIVAKEVEPKKRRLEEMNAELAQANAILAEKRAHLQDIVDKVEALQAQCERTVAEKNRLMEESDLTKKRLVRAEKLTKGLAAEGIRWNEQAGEVAIQVEKLVGDMFVAAACISYYGAFTGTYRAELLQNWVSKVVAADVPCSEGFNLMQAIGDPVDVREWQLQGLPTDEVSTDNALLVQRGERWPLMIDPQGQAKQWVRNMESRNNLEVTKLSNVNLLRSLENSIRVGRPLLLEDIEETLDPALEPVLNKSTFTTGGRLLIHLGDSDVDYHPDFRMYLTTKLPNPHYLPEVCIKVTLINCTVTMPGLVDQLLGVVVKKERPDIERRKNRLVMSMAADQKQLKDIEDKILKMLSESKGNILDDEALITALANSKNMSGIISERVAESQRTNAEITEMRLKYQPVAVRGSIIYFVVADLALIDPMYQYSLEYFTRLFTQAMSDAPKNDLLERRLENLIDYQTSLIYNNICRGLFETHKLIFSFLICSRILSHRGEIDPLSWNLLLRGGIITDRAAQPPNPNPKRLTALQWDLLTAAGDSVPEFTGIAADVRDNFARWEMWADSPTPHLKALPGEWEERMTGIQKLCLVKALREQTLVAAVRSYVKDKLGAQFITSPPVSMEDIHNDMTPSTPCIFILSQGADPTGILLRFAEEQKMTEKLNVISLGQGQGPKAEQLIEDALVGGEWVLLQNCHLAKSWMPRLEKVVVDLRSRESEMHPTFRLFLTSFPASYFPVAVLQNGVKLTNEPPRGLRANLARSYELLLKEDEFETCGGVPGAWKKILFGLAFFHAVVQERRKFGPLGWNIRYEFNDTDLETSVAGLRIFLESQPDNVPWDALSYVTGEINYGGRVTDDWDRRCLRSILKTYITPRILDDDYRFSESGVYYAPSDGSLESYKKYIASLPDDDSPEIFGMHSNADITFHLQESSVLLSTVLAIQPRSVAASSGQSPDEVVLAVSKTIADGLPAKLRHSEAGRTTFTVRSNGLMDSLATVLQQEMAKFNRLLARVSSSLTELARAIKGLVVMSAELDKMYTSLLNNQVPELWAAVAYPSLKPLASWVKDLTARVAFMRKWLTKGQPKAFPLPVFFFPQGFMTGTLQNHSRKYQVPINALDFSFNVLHGTADDIVSAPDDGVVCYGMWMEGARWDPERRMLADSLPGEMYSAMPPVHFLPVANYTPNPAEYSCPVYKTSVRAGALSTTGISTNFVVAVDLPTDMPPEYFVWKGAAFLLNLNI